MKKNVSNLILKVAQKLATAKNEKIYLVGGYVRDLLLHRVTYDIDFALDGNVARFSRTLTQKLKGKFFLLDEKTQTFRVVLGKKSANSKSWNIDISKIQGKDIIADLKRRDFTIDAMAIDLRKCQSANLIDPFNGLQDIKKHIIRVTSVQVLNADPLRLLRAFRLAATLNFEIEAKTLKAISAHSSFIKKVSRERIRDELFKILRVDNSYEYIRQIDKIEMLAKIIPQIKKIKQEPGLWKHSLLTLQFLEKMLKKNILFQIWSGLISKKVINHLENEISEQNTRCALLKFTSLFHDIGKPSTKKVLNRKASFIGHDRVGAEILKKISENLRLNNKEIKIILKISRLHMRVHYLVNLNFITKRAIARLTRDAEDEIIELLLFTLADFLATPEWLKKPKVGTLPKVGPLSTVGSLEEEGEVQTLKKNQGVTKKIVREYFKFKESKKFIRLITGDDLIKRFHMKEGPEIGKILEELELAQREGKIKTRQEALRLTSNLLNH